MSRERNGHMESELKLFVRPNLSLVELYNLQTGARKPKPDPVSMSLSTRMEPSTTLRYATMWVPS